jgi:hypothetical protein
MAIPAGTSQWTPDRDALAVATKGGPPVVCGSCFCCFREARVVIGTVPVSGPIGRCRTTLFGAMLPESVSVGIAIPPVGNSMTRSNQRNSRQRVGKGRRCLEQAYLREVQARKTFFHQFCG